MPGETELLTLAETAVVAGVSVRDVNCVIDEKILPERFYTLDGGRRVRFAGCAYVGFYFQAAKALTADTRSHVIRLLSERGVATGPEAWTLHDGYLTIDLQIFANAAEDRRAALAEARDMVVEDAAILGGIPVLRGTRVPVYDVAASVAAGLTAERIRLAYPGLDDRSIALAAVYAEATPARGRPRGAHAIEQRLKLVSERKVQRRGRR